MPRPPFISWPPSISWLASDYDLSVVDNGGIVVHDDGCVVGADSCVVAAGGNLFGVEMDTYPKVAVIFL